ncbi:MAG: HD domain-containing protein [Armatimonadetes bacterium]|nr:HD domain-containing protein [Armatimonadota bacterium]
MVRPLIALRRAVTEALAEDSRATRIFRWTIVVTAVALAARIFILCPASDFDPPFTGLAAGVAALVAVVMVALGSLFPLPLGHKIYLSLGSGAAFAALLVFPPHSALPLVFAGTLITQIIRRGHGHSLTPAAIVFNLAQYLVTWSLSAEVYYRAQAEPFFTHPALSWVPVVAAGAVYLLVNTWVVATMAALGRQTWTWALWVRTLREGAPGYVASLSLGAATASLAVTRPVLVLLLVPSLALLRQVLARMSGVIVRQTGAAFEGLVKIVEQRSSFTARHSERVSWLAQRLARRLDLSEDDVEAVGIAAKLHDLGKVIQRTNLEEKPGPLTPEEWAMIHQAPEIAAEVIARLPGFEGVARFVRYQRERCDGRGQHGLAGEAIPVGARIIAAADAFDAMVTSRPYRPALSCEQTLAQLIADGDTRFDRRVVAALLALVDADGGSIPAAEPRSGVVLQWPAVSSN